MLRFKAVSLSASLLALSTLIAGCGSGEPKSPLTDPDGVLGFVPADTAFVFATPEPMPDAVLDKIEANSDSLYAAYETILENSLTEVASELEAQGDAEQAKLAMALGREISGLLQSENLRAAGVPRGAQMALYGVGLVPVLRIELSNPVAFEAKIAEIEASAEGEMNVGEVEGTSYRYLGTNGGRLVLAVIDNYAVAGVLPETLPNAAIAEVLGITRPRRNIAGTGTLETLANDYSFAAHALGFIDFTTLAATFLETPQGVNAALFEQMGYDPSDLSDVCRSDIRSFAALMPRMVAGYTNVDPERLDSNIVFELRSDIALGLSAIGAPVPGLGTDQGGLFSIGMSVDVMAARDFLESRFDAYEAEPYQCAYFADVEAGIAQARQSMNQPLPPVVYSFKGFLGVVDRIEGLDLTGQQPPSDVDARLIIANDNAEALIAMGAMFSPELASLNLQPDGAAVELPLPPVGGAIESAWVAMTENALGLAIGKGSADRLTELLGTPGKEPSPTMSFTLDGTRYYRFMSEAIEAGSAADGGDNLPEDVKAAMSTAMTGIGNLIDRITVDVVFTERGVEVPSTVTLAD